MTLIYLVVCHETFAGSAASTQGHLQYHLAHPFNRNGDVNNLEDLSFNANHYCGALTRSHGNELRHFSLGPGSYRRWDGNTHRENHDDDQDNHSSPCKAGPQGCQAYQSNAQTRTQALPDSTNYHAPGDRSNHHSDASHNPRPCPRTLRTVVPLCSLQYHTADYPTVLNGRISGPFQQTSERDAA